MASPAEIANEIAQIQALLSAIGHDVTSVLDNALVKLIPAVPNVLSWIHDRITQLYEIVSAVGNGVKEQIGATIGAIVPTAVDFLVSILKTFSDNVTSILGNLATAEEFIGGAVNELKRHAGEAAGWLVGAVGGGLAGGMINAFTIMEGEHRVPIDTMLEHMLSNPNLPPFMKTQMEGVKSRGAPWMALLLPLMVAVAIRPLAEAAVNPAVVWAFQEGNKLLPEVEMPPPSAIEGFRKGIITYQEFKDAMARHGFNEHRALVMYNDAFRRLDPPQLVTLLRRGDMSREDVGRQFEQGGMPDSAVDPLQKAMAPLLTEDQIRQTFLRGIIDRPAHDALMRQHGYTQERIDKLVNLYYIIPGPADLIHMGIRNVFDPEIVERFDLAKDAPTEFFKAAAMQGISNDWALKFWEAHWIVPGIEEAFRMFQRTVDVSEDPDADTLTLLDGTKVKNIIGTKTLNLFLKDKDVPPYYRKKMTQIAYHPLNRIDIRRMYSVGSLDKAGVQRAYLNLGYSLPNATLLADFVERLYTVAKKDKAQPLIDGLRRRVLQLFVEDKLDLSDASFALTDLNFTAAEADYYLREARMVQHAEDAKEIEAGIGKLYQKRYITEVDARTRLQKGGVPAAAIERLMRKWNLQIEYAQDTEHFHKTRELSKSEVTTAYKDGLMTNTDALALFEKLGYPLAESQMLLHVADYQKEGASRKAMQDAIKALYVSGIRDAQATSNALDGLFLPAVQRDALLAEWLLLRETRTEKLPIATLRDMLKARYLTRDQAFEHLKRHRYTDNDASLLIDFWSGIKPQGA
jgi:hypothetical protein